MVFGFSCDVQEKGEIDAILGEFVGIFSAADLNLWFEERLGHSNRWFPSVSGQQCRVLHEATVY
jgi:hypothetical protein